MADGGSPDIARLVKDSQEIWDSKAAFWDAGMGDGNLFQRVLVGPASERLLDIQPGQAILDIACGNGVFARRLAEIGAQVVAADFSPSFLELARARTSAHHDRIEYVPVDATNEDQIIALGTERFDSVVCNMALMDMPVIEPLMRGVRQVLKTDGRFVCTVQHPAFNSNATRLMVEEDFPEGGYELRQSIKVSNYLNVPSGKGPGMPGEPVPHWYFHRPLHELLGACFAAGFVVDGLEEPVFGPEHASSSALSWTNMHGIPPVLAARLRIAG